LQDGKQTDTRGVLMDLCEAKNNIEAEKMQDLPTADV
jgi:hypothetical protein